MLRVSMATWLNSGPIYSQPIEVKMYYEAIALVIEQIDNKIEKKSHV